MGPKARLDGYGKYRPYRVRSAALTAHSKSLYRLSYPGPRFTKSTCWVGLLKENGFMLAKSTEDLQVVSYCAEICKKGKVIPLQARCGPEGGWRYSSTLP